MSADEWFDENRNPMLGTRADVADGHNRPTDGGQQMEQCKAGDEAMTGDGEQAGLFKLIEVDRMTGGERYLDNMGTEPWSVTFTREEAEASVKWREEHIVGRYGYRIVPVEPHMTDNGAARERHDGSHGSFRMEDCGDVDCHAATMRLLAARQNRPSLRRR